MKRIEWNKEKNEKLIKERGFSFDQVAYIIATRGPVDIYPNPQSKYSHQYIYVVEINEKACLVPFVEDDGKIFLKTIIPSTKLTKKYDLGKKK